MRDSIRNVLTAAALAVAAVSAAGPPVLAENIDPAGSGARFAWGENFGWFNAQPLGRGGPGLEVEDFEVTGWLWGENTGWVSTSCKNTASCDRVEFGVRNDGAGNLWGFAWAENFGWINFRPMYGGVHIDPATGEWSGTAWTENGGWINFGFDFEPMYRIRTSWTCGRGTPPPAGMPQLTVVAVPPPDDDIRLSWIPATGSAGEDVIRGDLVGLHGTGGDFRQATTACLRDNTTMPDLLYTETLNPGEAAFYAVRDVNCVAAGTYDTAGAGLAAPRDAGIALSGNDCP